MTGQPHLLTAAPGRRTTDGPAPRRPHRGRSPAARVADLEAAFGQASPLHHHLPLLVPTKGALDRLFTRARGWAAGSASALSPYRAPVASPHMATTNDLKNGMVLNLDGELWTVVEFQHVKPGKGGAFVRTTLKNVLTGKVVDKTFNAGTKVDVGHRRQARHDLPLQGGHRLRLHGHRHLRPGARPGADRRRATPTTCSRTPTRSSPCTRASALYVELPDHRRAGHQHTDPGLQGDRSTGGTKPATLETGAEIQVPLFITTGEKIKVDTRDGRYLGRVNET